LGGALIFANVIDDAYEDKLGQVAVTPRTLVVAAPDADDITLCRRRSPRRIKQL
jgi:hypothetical protein